MTHTHKLTVVTQRIYDLINANKVPLAIDDVWYGDQDIVPHARTVCVEPATVSRPMSGAPDMVTNTFVVGVLVYITRVDQSVQDSRKECDNLAQDIEDLLHQHLSLTDNTNTPGSDIVIHGWVHETLSGYTYKRDRLIRSARLTWQGISKTSLRFGP